MTTTTIYLKNAINECDQLIKRYKDNQDHQAKMLVVQIDAEKKAFEAVLASLRGKHGNLKLYADTELMRMLSDDYDPPTEDEQRYGKVQVKVTAGVLLDKGLWDKACKLTGLNIWAINEGLMDSSDEVSLTQEQAQELGLVTI